MVSQAVLAHPQHQHEWRYTEILIAGFPRRRRRKQQNSLRNGDTDDDIVNAKLPAELSGQIRKWDIVLAVNGVLVQGTSIARARRILKRAAAAQHLLDEDVENGFALVSPIVHLTLLRRSTRKVVVLTCKQCDEVSLYPAEAIATTTKNHQHHRDHRHPLHQGECRSCGGRVHLLESGHAHQHRTTIDFAELAPNSVS